MNTSTLPTPAISSHTPGPWTEDPEGTIAVAVEDANGKVIADVYGPATDNPNARLIAACPLMFAYITARASAGDDEAKLIIDSLGGSN